MKAVLVDSPAVQKNINTVIFYSVLTFVCAAISCGEYLYKNKDNDDKQKYNILISLAIPVALLFCAVVGTKARSRCLICCNCTAWFFYSVYLTLVVVLCAWVLYTANKLKGDWTCAYDDINTACKCTSNIKDAESFNLKGLVPKNECTADNIHKYANITMGVVLAFALLSCMCACDAFRAGKRLCGDPYFTEPEQRLVGGQPVVVGQQVPMVPQGNEASV
jgi:hypothetical protein